MMGETHPADLALIVFIAMALTATAVVRRRRPLSRYVFICRLGVLVSERGATGLQHVRFSDGHTKRRIVDRQWVRQTSSEDDQITAFFRLNDGCPASRVSGSRRVLGVVEYYDSKDRIAPPAFALDYSDAEGTFQRTPSEAFTQSGRWRTAYFDLSSMVATRRFPRGLPPGAYGADIRLHAANAYFEPDLVLKRFTVVVLDTE